MKVAIVGCGNISRRHAESYAAAGAELVDVADIVPAKAAELAAKYGARAHSDATQLLAATDAELISVATPPGSHAELAVQILAAGRSVLLEKPPVLSLAEMDAVASAERASAASAYVVFQHRHGSGGVRAADLLRRGVLGVPQVAVCETLWFRPRSYFDPEWRGTWVGEGGGPTLGHGIHQIDLLLHLLGPWRSIQATAVRLDRPVEFEDVSMASVVFESGAVATVINSLLSPRELSRIRIDTTGGTLEVNHVYGYSDADWTFHAVPDAARAAQLGLNPGVPGNAEAATGPDQWADSAGDDVPSNHEAQIQRLLDDLAAGRSHDTTLASTRPTMEFVTALYASAVTGTPVRRADLVTGHPFYRALRGDVDQDRIDAMMRI
ncbi:Gfo/Idh/MocA family oxidoreductase [Kribbella sandramycini]|uniref:Gfo/Idh/MocA family oxidoreductase n=1 Tax=Kribbella sandramycini TaxID=60450 RepID=A0A7Y4L794_9ACTN|nr:Gfo/Idh/MocA family oxidoreductase [Kribbella sandramycini]MBB6570191.1 putative dehydrogenase [Kribbella sandramycini]NOL45684.1 Gfo/Idh/MocA family oxidoreductase [Kribbella sandramycini]